LAGFNLIFSGELWLAIDGFGVCRKSMVPAVSWLVVANIQFSEAKVSL